MPLPAIQIHLFRVFVPHLVRSLDIQIKYPVTGCIVVPSTTTSVSPYIEQRQGKLGQLRMPVMMRTSRYSQTVTAMALAPEIREIMGLEPRMPSGSLEHSARAETCKACREIALCEQDVDGYLKLRANLERICHTATRVDPASCQALEARLNNYAA